MNYIFYLIFANIGIFWLEYVYRNGTYGSFWQALPVIFIPIMMGQYGLYYGFKLAPSLFIAGTLFTVINVALRVINTYRLGEHLNLWNWLGVILLLVALILLKVR